MPLGISPEIQVVALVASSQPLVVYISILVHLTLVVKIKFNAKKVCAG